MHRNATLRKLALAAVVIGAGTSAVPAMASASSSCVYNEFGRSVVVNDYSGSQTLELVRADAEIRIAEGFGARFGCSDPVTGKRATVTNTDRIAVFAAPAQTAGGYSINQVNGAFTPGATKEADGGDEIEITFDTTGVAAKLTVYGDKNKNVMSVTKGGSVNFAYDLDPDVTATTPFDAVYLHGALGNDELDGRGGGMLPASDVHVLLAGEGGDDLLVDGDATDIIEGGAGNDRIFSETPTIDDIRGGTGFDTATTSVNDIVNPDLELQTIKR